MNPINKYIDVCLVDQYADKDLKYGYSLDVQCLDQNEQSHFLDMLIKNDPIMKDIVLDRMQEVINERLRMIESHSRYDSGMKPLLDQMTGEVNWIMRGAA